MVKIFAHRGYRANNSAENSLQSLDEAVANNFHGIEIDIHFAENKLIISHDSVTQENMQNYSEFAEFLKYQNQILYWLDFKNLHNLSDRDLDRALKLALNAIKTAKCNLGQFYFAPYITDFTESRRIYSKIREIFSDNVKIMAVCDNLKSDEYQNFYENLLQENITHLSIKHSLINSSLLDILNGVEIFAWTVNDIDSALSLTKKLDISNFTTDSITPQQFSDQ